MSPAVVYVYCVFALGYEPLLALHPANVALFLLNVFDAFVVNVPSYVTLCVTSLPLPPVPALYVIVYPLALQLQLVPLHVAAVPVLLLLV